MHTPKLSSRRCHSILQWCMQWNGTSQVGSCQWKIQETPCVWIFCTLVMMENFHVLGLLPCQKPAMENWPKETKKEGSHINRLSLSLKESKEKYYHMLCSSWISTDGTYLLLCNWRKNGFYSILTRGLQFLHTFCVIHADTLILLNLLYFLCITPCCTMFYTHQRETAGCCGGTFWRQTQPFILFIRAVYKDSYSKISMHGGNLSLPFHGSHFPNNHI